MSLNQGIKHHKEHRKEYRGAKAIDKTCRNHGGCSFCKENRLHSSIKREESMKAKEKEYEKEMGAWEKRAREVEEVYGGIVNWEDEFYICPYCEEPVYKEDWEEYTLEKFLCPVCEDIDKED